MAVTWIGTAAAFCSTASLLLPLVSLLGGATSGQDPCADGSGAALLDSGTFVLSVGSREVGTESFVVLKGDSRTLAQGRIEMRDGRVLRTSLCITDSGGTSPHRYEASISGDDSASVRMVRLGGRLESRRQGFWGESLREYPGGPSTVVLENGVAHHYFVLREILNRVGSEELYAVAPIADEAFAFQAGARQPSGSPPSEVDSGGAGALRLQGADGRREVWFDEFGRLIRIEIEKTGFAAVRAQPRSRQAPKS